MEEFSRKGYSRASLNTVWAEKGFELAGEIPIV